ncbi:MAG TPA: glycosyltransferase [Blastocatellia bacterium]|nr:glycosyltransferase [Blastocatellia bacterium]
MRVLHVYSGNLYGGVETLLLTLARHKHLCLEMEPSFALSFEGRLSEELMNARTPVHLLGGARVSRPLSVLRTRRALRNLLERESFDAVICHSSWSQAIFGPVARLARAPLFFWLHDRVNGRHWLELWARKCPPDVAVCNSQFTASTLSNLFPQARAEVIYCPVAPPLTSYSSLDRDRARAELATPADSTVIIQASRMEKWKGHLLNLKALSLLRDIPNWVCWLAGGGQRPHEAEYFNELKETAERLKIADRIRFLGQRSDVERLLAAADIHCQPNTGPEPFGIAFIEALLARLPVVTTAIGGAREIVSPDCGVLVPPDDEQALGRALRQLIEDRALRERLGSGGPARAKELCDPATQIEKLRQSLADCISERAIK